MSTGPAYARITSDVIAIIRRIPAGRLATHGQIGNHLKVSARHIASLLAALDDAERATLPWWRVVADGGAIGRHVHRDVQIARLKADGVPVAPAGIAQELRERLMVSLDPPRLGVVSRPEPVPAAPLSRSRGMKGKPSSTV